MKTQYWRLTGRVRSGLLFLGPILFLLVAAAAWATPPHYRSFDRAQQIDYAYDDMALMRIWIVYVGQGDGILIQLPEQYNYDPDPADGGNDKRERLDIMIDGGSHKSANAHLMSDFLQNLYDPARINIENAVVTHHDSDHILGLTAILEAPNIAVEHIYHNGLASYRNTGRIKSAVDSAARSIVKKKHGQIDRVLAVLASDEKTIKDDIVLHDIGDLKNSCNEGLLHGIYEDLAQAVLEKQAPVPVAGFSRTWDDGAFLPQWPDISFKVLWPREMLRSYSTWGETINGNSVTFLLKYKEFEMLFTGDHNEKSERELIASLEAGNRTADLRCDVLKAPHHGSAHNMEAFIRPDGRPAVITVASMGEKGFGTSWKHPSPEVIRWAGGAHRFYSTHIHERRFSWDAMRDAGKFSEMLERTHILIETDGLMFRVVEVDARSNDLNNPPPVRKVKRSNGTRWIEAAE